MKPGLFRLEGIEMAVAKSVTGPKWNKLFPVNTTRFRSDFPGGRIDFTPEFLQSMIDNWARIGQPGLPVDYSHEEKGPASGWIEGLELRDDGLYAAIRWTDAARAAITADELRYLSPTFAVDGEDSMSGQAQGPTLYGAALLNTPFLQDLPRVAASAIPHAPPKPKEQRMNPKDLARTICQALGLPDGTDNETMMSALTKCFAPVAAPTGSGPVATPAAVKTGNPHVGDLPSQTAPADMTPKYPATPTSPETMLPPADNEGGSLAPPSKTVVHPVSMSAASKVLELENKVLQSRIAALEKKDFERDVATLTSELIRAGRVTSAQAEQVAEYAQMAGVERARTFFAKLPALSLAEKGHGDDNQSDPVADESKARTLLFEKATALQKDNPKLSIADATRRVRAENPELAKAVSFAGKPHPKKK